jgi:chromosome partitioning protein
VGKTTTAVNLGASLAIAEKKTLIVDVDPQGNSTTGLGIERPTLQRSLYHALIGEASLPEILLQSELPYLFVAPSTKDLTGAEIELVNAERREWRLRDALRSVDEQFEYILLDCPPSLGLLTLNAFTAAHSVLVPLQCEYYALEGLTSLLETVKLVQQGLNPDLHLEGILLTMFDSRNRLSHQVAEEIRSHFPDRLFHTVVYRNVRLSESPSHGKPALLYDIHSTGAQNYLDLAKELIRNREEIGRADTEKGTG